MEQPQIDAMTERLDGLERENHRMKRRIELMVLIGVVVSFGALAKMIGGAHSAAVIDARVVNAEDFTLRDRNGKVMGKLAIDNNGWPILAFYDKNSRNRINIGFKSEG